MNMSTIPFLQKPQLSAIYGPVKSWRFGRSLGIDPIGYVSTCSFNCVYCQLGKIQEQTSIRRIFVPTSQLLQELQAIAPWQYLDIDVITVSGSGEPTLALNLAEIITVIKKFVKRPIVVLTNGTKLDDSTVRSALALADIVSVKLDAVSSNQLRRINQPLATIDLPEIIGGIKDFRREYPGLMAIQTMVLSAWTQEMQADYIEIVTQLHPDEIQLNIPSRPRVLAHQLESRDNDGIVSRSYSCQSLQCINNETLISLSENIHKKTKIPVRCTPIALL
jgi:wyosine [tRNA(Phe)-imidazoG37] synthetase (radical SAM superfamily)